MIMEEWSVINGKKMRKGFTTGSCAAGATAAAVTALFSGICPETVAVSTPKGITLCLEIAGYKQEPNQTSCSIIKDAGDDPDATNGIEIWATVSKIDKGIVIDGGKGVGRVTKKGLASEIGMPAINPTPLKMIRQSAEKAALQLNYTGGLKIIISAENGEETAKHTFNERLGIMGGISILGTTGIVEPMSKEALIASIHLEIDQKAALGHECLLVCLGNISIKFADEKYGIKTDDGVKCANFIGETLDYALYVGFKKILVIGHAGKLVKLAGGIMDTHSRKADCRQEIFAAHASLAGATQMVVTEIMQAITTNEIDKIIENAGIKDMVWASIMEKIAFHSTYRLKNLADCRFIVFTNNTGSVKTTPKAHEFIEIIKNTEK